MPRTSVGMFLTRLRQWWFEWRLGREIHDQIGAQFRHEGDWGYPFNTREEMKAHTKVLKLRARLDNIERQIDQMPAFYGEAFRYTLHRELDECLRRFEQVAPRGVPPKHIDPRFVATRA